MSDEEEDTSVEGAYEGAYVGEEEDDEDDSTDDYFQGFSNLASQTNERYMKPSLKGKVARVVASGSRIKPVIPSDEGREQSQYQQSHLPRWPPCPPVGRRSFLHRKKGSSNAAAPGKEEHQVNAGSNPTTPRAKSSDGIFSPPSIEWLGEGIGSLDDVSAPSALSTPLDREEQCHSPSTPLGMPSHITSFVTSEENIQILNDRQPNRRLMFDEGGEVVGGEILEEVIEPELVPERKVKGKGKGAKKARSGSTSALDGDSSRASNSAGGGTGTDGGGGRRRGDSGQDAVVDRGTIGGGVLRVKVKKATGNGSGPGPGAAAVRANSDTGLKGGEKGKSNEDGESEDEGNGRRRVRRVRKSGAHGLRSDGGDKEERERENREILRGLEVCNLPRKMNGYEEYSKVGVGKVGSGGKVGNVKITTRKSTGSKIATATRGTGKAGKSSTGTSTGGLVKKKESQKKDALKKDTLKKGKNTKAPGRTDRVKAWDELRKSRKDWSFGKRMGL